MKHAARQLRKRAARQGMTLIELIVLLALLAAVMTFSAPALSRFIGGRQIQEEARRVLALTRYGRSEAVSRCVPMELWIDAATGTYGVSPQAGYAFQDDKEPVEFTLQEGLRFDVESDTLNADGRAVILFQTDGTIDAQSLASLRITDDEDEVIEIAQVDYGLGYEIQERRMMSDE